MACGWTRFGAPTSSGPRWRRGACVRVRLALASRMAVDRIVPDGWARDPEFRALLPMHRLDRAARLRAHPDAAPGLTHAEMIGPTERDPSEDLVSGGATAG